MGKNKVCINKRISYFAIGVLVVVGFVVSTNLVVQKKTSSSTRASSSAIVDEQFCDRARVYTTEWDHLDKYNGKATKMCDALGGGICTNIGNTTDEPGKICIGNPWDCNWGCRFSNKGSAQPVAAQPVATQPVARGGGGGSASAPTIPPTTPTSAPVVPTVPSFGQAAGSIRFDYGNAGKAIVPVQRKLVLYLDNTLVDSAVVPDLNDDGTVKTPNEWNVDLPDAGRHRLRAEMEDVMNSDNVLQSETIYVQSGRKDYTISFKKPTTTVSFLNNCNGDIKFEGFETYGTYVFFPYHKLLPKDNMTTPIDITENCGYSKHGIISIDSPAAAYTISLLTGRQTGIVNNLSMICATDDGFPKENIITLTQTLGCFGY